MPTIIYWKHMQIWKWGRKWAWAVHAIDKLYLSVVALSNRTRKGGTWKEFSENDLGDIFIRLNNFDLRANKQIIKQAILSFWHSYQTPPSHSWFRIINQSQPIRHHISFESLRQSVADTHFICLLIDIPSCAYFALCILSLPH